MSEYKGSQIVMTTNPNTALLAAADLAIGYPRPRGSASRLAEGISLDLQAGELVCLIGTNGAGKSTLLRTLAGLQAPLGGRVSLNGRDLHRLTPTERARGIAIVLTERVDTGLLSAYGVVALGRHPHNDWRGSLTARDHAVIRESLAAVGAEGLAHRPLSELSDGERQKVLIARALAQEGDVLILDEPTAFLDLPRRAEIMALLGRLARQTGRAVLLSSHDLDLALQTADRLWLLEEGGRFQAGAPEDLVLNGQLGRAFRSEGIRFNIAAGGFALSRTPIGALALVGEDDSPILLWTKRALARAGYALCPPTEGLPRITIHQDRWEIAQGNHRHLVESVYDLIQTLRTVDVTDSIGERTAYPSVERIDASCPMPTAFF